jgi:hypothetical protein
MKASASLLFTDTLSSQQLMLRRSSPFCVQNPVRMTKPTPEQNIRLFSFDLREECVHTSTMRRRKHLAFACDVVISYMISGNKTSEPHLPCPPAAAAQLYCRKTKCMADGRAAAAASQRES